MFQLLCFSTVILSANCQFLWFTDAMERIIHGSVVDISDFPYQVALVHRKRIICGGAIVKPRIIFTAAHCTHAGDADDFSVLVGANHLRDPQGRFYKIESIMSHPDFSSHDYEHDFSVIVLERPIQFNDRVQDIAISRKDDLGGSVGVVSGWGRTEYGTPSKYLRAIKVTVERWRKCQNYFPGAFHPKITENMVCVKPSRATSYFGDSGSPLVVHDKLVGLVSFGRTVREDKKATVFTKVHNYMSFVEDAIPDFYT